MYKWKAYGEYITAGKVKQIVGYEEEFELDESDRAHARAIIQNGMITERLRKNDNFYSVRTCQLEDEPEQEEGTSKTSELESLLLEATNLGCVPIDYDSASGVRLKKKLLKTAIEKKKERIAKAEAKDKKAKAKGEGWQD